MTDKERIIEKCMVLKDGEGCIYFIENFCRVLSQSGGRQNISLFPFQKAYIRTMLTNKVVIVLKPRQVGMSTITALLLLWEALFTPDGRFICISMNEDEAVELLGKVKVAFEELPTEIFEDLRRVSDKKIRFASDSEIAVRASGPNAGRSRSPKRVLMDEAAFMDKKLTNNKIETDMANRIYTAVQQSLNVDGKAAIVSCVAPDTWILTDKGLQQIADLAPANMQPGFNDIKEVEVYGKNGLHKTCLFYDSGTTPTKKIKTKHSYNIECSHIHPLLVMDTDGQIKWKRSAEIRVGECVAIQRGQFQFGDNDDVVEYAPSQKIRNRFDMFVPPRSINHDWAYLFGLILSEGYVHKNGLVITNVDQEIKDFLTNNKFGLKFRIEKDGVHIRCCSKHFVEFLQWMGFELGVKTIPKRLLSMSRPNICAMLSGMFDGDGRAEKRDGSVSLSSTSEKMLEQVKMLLLNMGIVTLTRWHWYLPTDTSRARVASFVGNLEINANDAKLFYHMIGFRLSRKQARYMPFRGNGGADCVPYINSILFSIKHESCFTAKQAMETFNVRSLSKQKLHYKEQKISYNLLQKFIDTYSDVENSDMEYIKGIMQKRWFFDTVVAIDDGASQTLDFCIPDDHTFFSNGFISHNTPNGCGGFFHRVWVMSTEGTRYGGRAWEHNEPPEVGINGVVPFLVRWDDFTTRDQAWFDAQKIEYKNRDREFAQEILAEFLGSGDNVLSVERIKEMEAQDMKVPLSMDNNRAFYTWEPPQQGVKYIIGLDVASGKGDDFHGVQIFRRDTLEQVAELKAQMDTQKLADFLYEKGRAYNNAEIVVETNYGMGVAMLDLLAQKGYYAIFRHDKTKKEGLHVTNIEREMMVNTLKEYTGSGMVGVRSQRLLNEFKTYVWRRNKAMAEPGFNDDLVSALQLIIFAKHSYKERTDANWSFKINNAANKGNLQEYLDKMAKNSEIAERKKRMEQMEVMGLNQKSFLTPGYVSAFNLLYHDDLSGY